MNFPPNEIGDFFNLIGVFMYFAYWFIPIEFTRGFMFQKINYKDWGMWFCCFVFWFPVWFYPLCIFVI